MSVVQVRHEGKWTYVNEEARDTIVVLPGLILEEAVAASCAQHCTAWYALLMMLR